MHLRFLAALFLLTHSALAANNFYGITIASFRPDGPCRTQDDWDSIVKTAKENGYKRFRIYANDCGTTYDYAIAAAKKNKVSVLVGVWVDGTIANSASNIDKDVTAFIAAAKNRQCSIDGLTIGNELKDHVNVMNKVWEIRDRLKREGVAVPVSTVPIWADVENNPVLCQGDRVTVNAYAFFDKNVGATGAGNFVRDIVLPKIRSVCGEKEVIITESGWPSQGGQYGVAVASLDQEQVALKNLNCVAKDISIFAFEAEDATWKKKTGDPNWDQREMSFGILNKGLDSTASDC